MIHSQSGVHETNDYDTELYSSAAFYLTITRSTQNAYILHSIKSKLEHQRAVL